jgi:apolipoprotein N-acyltransferase
VTLSRFAHSVVLAWGWRRAVIAFVAGAICNLGIAPFGLWPALFLGFPVLVWLIDGTTARRWNGVIAAAGTGWLFGFGYFLFGLYWVGHAFLVDAKTFGWLLPFPCSPRWASALRARCGRQDGTACSRSPLG